MTFPAPESPMRMFEATIFLEEDGTPTPVRLTTDDPRFPTAGEPVSATLDFYREVDISRVARISVAGTGPWAPVAWTRSHLSPRRWHVCLAPVTGQKPEVSLAEVMESLKPLAAELLRARRKFPSNQYMFAALAEEIGEMAEAWLQEGDTPHARQEALQVACVAMRIFTEGVNREGEDKTTLLTMKNLEGHARSFFADLKDRPDLQARSEPQP